MPDVSVKESKERIKAAIKNTDLKLESRRIVINLSPADTKKEGAMYDLPMAIGILIASGYIQNINIDTIIFVGELSLNGRINKINGIFPITLEAAKIGMKKIILPKENAKEASIVQDIEVIGVESLKDVIQYLLGEKSIVTDKMDLTNIFNNNTRYKMDFSDVKGQENVKRALEVAAARRSQHTTPWKSAVHGKTLMAKCLPSILPDLTLDEALEVTKIHSIAGLIEEDIPIITKRPFRAPHHTISGASLIRSVEEFLNHGEISLSHNGVLFLDELTEFNKQTLELMRGPLEDRKGEYKQSECKFDISMQFYAYCINESMPMWILWSKG